MVKKLLTVFNLFILVLIPAWSFAQTAPNLGSAASFALFTSAGNITNTNNSTTVTGNAGTNSGSITAFPPGNLVGTKQVNNATTAQAAADVSAAYSNLSAQSCSSTIPSALGGQTLTPGVYCVSGNATMTSNLTLNGQNNPNAIFIIKISGSLTTSNNTNIVLTNGATACNVYFQVNGPVTLAQNVNFYGTILANGAFTLNNGATLTGRALTQTGTISLSRNTVTVPAPSNAAITGNLRVCPGTTTTLTASGGATYMWSTGSAAASINVGPGTYTVTATSSTGCTSTATATVTAFPAPVATITASGPTTFCEGDSVVLTANDGSAFMWSSGANTQSLTVKTSGNFSVMVTDSNGCVATSAPVTVTVNPNPTVTLTPDGSLNLCPGGSVTLTASAGASYLFSTGDTTQSITVFTAGTYNVMVTYANGCTSSSDSLTVVILPVPPTTIDITGDTTFCQGGSVTLAANDAESFMWSTGDTTQQIVVTMSGTYSVTGFYAGGCSSVSAPVVITVNPLPVPVITADGPIDICFGDSVTLTSTSAEAYLFSTGDTTRSITVSAAGSYSVTVTDSNGCMGTSAVIAVTVKPNPVPVITAGGPLALCPGGSVALTASAGASFLFSNGDTTQSINATAAGDYFVTVTYANGCSATSDTTTVTVNATPPTIITASGPLTFCAGDSVTLTSSAAMSYMWSTGEITRSIVVTESGSYSVTGTYAGNCTSTSAVVNVVVNPLPVAAITASGPLTFCPGDSVTLAASGGASYLFSTGDTTQAITVSASGNYFVTVTDSNGCSATSVPVIVTVLPAPTPTLTPGGATTFCMGASLTLTSSAAASYQFSTGATTQSINVTTGGSYFVTVTYANGCVATSEPIEITVDSNPVPTITADTTTIFCQGGSVTLIASSANAYMWNTGATTQSIVVTMGGSYSVTAFYTGGCSATSDCRCNCESAPCSCNYCKRYNHVLRRRLR